MGPSSARADAVDIRWKDLSNNREGLGVSPAVSACRPGRSPPAGAVSQGLSPAASSIDDAGRGLGISTGPLFVTIAVEKGFCDHAYGLVARRR